AAPAAAPAPAGPVSGGDLSAKRIVTVNPVYPLESRRQREMGTVVLNLLLGTDGRVSEISVATSSGFARLDRAALDAVRKWRWAPTTRNGEPVMVRGIVPIPFVLAG
ncbi:MAG TPA: energy transducer TonB, partial [Novosphingobium sp.]|nr:energy transducer TonB [Novosphingobium sp.]